MTKQGWGLAWNFRKAHYFIESRSLCGRWMYFGKLEDARHDHSDNCKKCRSMLEKKYPEKLTEEATDD